jgi:hypothetical protein
MPQPPSVIPAVLKPESTATAAAAADLFEPGY